MSDNHREEAALGTIIALLKRGAISDIPKLKDIRNYVDKGRPLSDSQIEFLSEVFQDEQRALPYIDRHPELREMAVKSISLYHEIMDKATENEEAAIKQKMPPINPPE